MKFIRNRIFLNERVIRFFPLVMLIIDAIAVCIYKLSFWPDFALYILNQTTGHSLLCIWFMWVYAVRRSYCLYLKIALVGLSLLNLYNIAYYLFSMNDYLLYAGIIIFVSLAISIVFLIKNR